MIQFCSIFSELLQLFPRLEFQRRVNETRTDVMLEGSPLEPICGHVVLSIGAHSRRTR